MKCTIFIDKEHEEEVIIYAHEESGLVASIKELTEKAAELTAFSGSEIVPLNINEVFFFTTDNSKVLAVTEKEKLTTKLRLYEIEERLPDCFIKINQSTIANIKKIDRFDTSVSGTLKVKFKNGAVDYVSRRNIRKVKERLGY